MMRISRLFAIVVALSSSLAYGQLTLGDLHGITRNGAGLPQAEVKVVVRRVDSNTERSVVSNDRGAFRVESLKPGRYQLTASKVGYAGSSVTSIELAAQQSLQVDITLRGPNEPKVSAVPGQNPDQHGQVASANPAAEPLTARERQMLARLNQLEQRLAALEAKDAKESTPPPAITQTATVTTPEEAVTQSQVVTQPTVVTAPGKGATPPVSRHRPYLWRRWRELPA